MSPPVDPYCRGRQYRRFLADFPGPEKDHGFTADDLKLMELCPLDDAQPSEERYMTNWVKDPRSLATSRRWWRRKMMELNPEALYGPAEPKNAPEPVTKSQLTISSLHWPPQPPVVIGDNNQETVHRSTEDATHPMIEAPSAESPTKRQPSLYPILPGLESKSHTSSESTVGSMNHTQTSTGDGTMECGTNKETALNGSTEYPRVRPLSLYPSLWSSPPLTTGSGERPVPLLQTAPHEARGSAAKGAQTVPKTLTTIAGQLEYLNTRDKDGESTQTTQVDSINPEEKQGLDEETVRQLEEIVYAFYRADRRGELPAPSKDSVAVPGKLKSAQASSSKSALRPKPGEREDKPEQSPSADWGVKKTVSWFEELRLSNEDDDAEEK
ncbi:hypothetical protein NW762_012881 [Fusarium torreyae]|uniref:Uncharacterized protein n=1 Tax=Fusarium torreyae TaxID=1237075 RepID=A0A9W8V8B4_9HYPO|nr:hypothetical protein NW762_012881 [Fusarium torreyae]